MEEIHKGNSAVARLLAEIQEEYEAATLGIKGLAAVASHEVINRKMENMLRLQEELSDIVGPCAATMLVDLHLQNCSTL